MWAEDAKCITFSVGATYDILSQWVGEDRSCKLCMGVCSLKHLLSGCKTGLTPGSQQHGDIIIGMFV